MLCRPPARATEAAQESAPEAGAEQPVDLMRMSVPEMLAYIPKLGELIFDNEKRAAAMAAQVRATTNLRERVGLAFGLGRELLALGRTERAIELFLEIRGVFERPGSDVHPSLRRQLGAQLAVAYLRLGEQQNCVERHTADSCILPIRPEGRHRLERGSRAAMAELEALLGERPDLGFQWLLNVAAMTVGDYPEAVPEAWRIPPETFASEHPLPRFENLATPTGTDVFGTSGGVVMEDLDGDGLLDLMVSAWGVREQLRLLRNRGDGTFRDETEAAGLVGEVGGLNLVHADYDSDGDADVLVLRGAWLGSFGLYPNSLLENQGVDATGRLSFRNVTRDAGLLSLFPTQTAAWADYDLDGRLDLFIGNESGPDIESPCQLYHNDGAGADGQVRFTNVAAATGLDVRGFVKGAVWGDVDNDGRPDLYLSRFDEPNQLFLNLGPGEDGGWRFVEVAAEAGVSEPRRSFPTWFWDYDNDGWLDLLVAPYSGLFGESLSKVVADYLGRPSAAETGRLYRNLGPGRDGRVTFVDATAEIGFDRALLAMGANFGDLDNDGWLDAYFGTGEPSLATLVPNRMFRNDAGRRFQEVTTAGGFGHLQKGHGVAFGDIDNDGDQDIYAVMGGAYAGDGYSNALFVNPGGGGSSLTLVLEGVASNRAAIGARVRVVARTAAGERSIYRTVGTGGSFGSSPLQRHVGLGEATAVERVEVRWPRAGGAVELFTGIEPGGAYRLREGSGRAEPLERRRLGLPRPGEGHGHDHGGR
jgi:hypothetical protein